MLGRKIRPFKLYHALLARNAADVVVLNNFLVLQNKTRSCREEAIIIEIAALYVLQKLRLGRADPYVVVPRNFLVKLA